MDVLKSYFGQRLRMAMEKAHLNQSELAEKMDVKPSAVSRWVNGHDLPEDFRLPELYKFLKSNESDFFEFEKRPIAVEQKILDILEKRLPEIDTKRLIKENEQLKSEIEELKAQVEKYQKIPHDLMASLLKRPHLVNGLAKILTGAFSSRVTNAALSSIERLGSAKGK